MPSGLSLSFHQHSRQTEVAFLQKEWSEPFKKRLWQFIVKNKILNQARCLSFYDRETAEYLFSMAQKIQSGDPDNKEAQGARHYWRYLIEGFKRGEDDILNSAFNFGYAIVRGLLSRSIVASGLIPCFGLHHKNKLNPYNLSDDLVEFFRPIVDLKVLKMRPFSQRRSNHMTRKERQDLARIITCPVLIQGEEMGLKDACDRVVLQLVSCTRQKSIHRMISPELNAGSPFYEK